MSVASEILAMHLLRLAAERLGPPLTLAEVEDGLYRLGRNHAPAALYDLFAVRPIPPDVLRAVLAGVWSAAELPHTCLSRGMWLYFFARAEYPKPPTPLTVYRGASSRHARGMSWSTDQDRAAWFARRWPGANLYTVTVQPDAVLCDVDAVEREGGRRECEIIVHPAGLPPAKRLWKGESVAPDDAAVLNTY
jgi:hypothetical protein